MSGLGRTNALTTTAALEGEVGPDGVRGRGSCLVVDRGREDAHERQQRDEHQRRPLLHPHRVSLVTAQSC